MNTTQTLVKSSKILLLICLLPALIYGAEPGNETTSENGKGFAFQQYTYLKQAIFKKIKIVGNNELSKGCLFSPGFGYSSPYWGKEIPAPVLIDNFTTFLGATYTYNNTTSGTLNDQSNCSTTLLKTFNVTDNFIINDLNVGLNFSHTWRGDVRVRLTSPFGTTVTLIVQDNADSYDNQDFMLDDESGNAINNGVNNTTASPNYDADRSAAPNNPLSAFDGQNAIGTWTLEFCNVNQGGSGGRVLTFNSARLEFDGTSASVEICNNGIDDDGDGLIDSADPDCSIVFKQLYLSDPSQALDRVDPVATADATTASTVNLNGSSGVTVVNTVTNSSSNPGSTTFTVSNVTVGTESDRLMLVGISQKNRTISSVTYGGTPLTLVGQQVGSSNARVHLYSLLNPPSGTANVVVTLNSNPDKGIVVGVTNFSGVNQTTPLGTFNSATANSNAASVTVASATGELVFDVATYRNATMSQNAGQTALYNINSGDEIDGGGASTKAGASSVTMGWAGASSQQWAIGAVSIKPAVYATNTTFTQNPVLCSPLTIKAGQPITVTNYITIASGTMPASPNITALVKYGGTNIISLTNPTYNSGTGLLTWTGTLGSDVTVPAGQAIALQVTTAQSGVAFNINYDSQTKPSKINLPVSTFIKILSFDIYSAPYPGGSIVTGIVGGTTVYPRAVVSDPFGFTDITGLDITITPTGSTVAATSVATSGCTRTFEYAWVTPVATNTYNIKATAKEGFENTVTDIVPVNRDICTPAIGTPVFAGGATSSRCQIAGTTVHSATSTNATGITYSLDATSLAAGNTINTSNGTVTFVAGWTGNSVITATATGCGGPKTATHTVTTNPAPSVSTSANVTICAGGSTTVTATGSGGTSPYTYSWSNGLGSGASRTASPASSTTYTVTLTDNRGCTATNLVGVSVVPAPAITAQPASSSICTGVTQTLSVTATGGTPSLTYQWRSSANGSTGWVNISGATSNSYTTPVLNNTAYYRVVVSAGGTGCASVTSSVATVTVVSSPTISSQPTGSTICNGGTFSLSVSASGGATYQWQSSTNNVTFTNISGATSANYTTPALSATAYYRVVVSVSGCGSVTSNTATVTVAAPPSVTTSSNVSICPGASTTISSSATGSSPFTYAWSNGLGSGGSKTVTPLSTITYTVTVTDSNGCTGTSQVTVTVGTPIVVTTTPNTTICSGVNTTITASATGSGPFSYAWDNGLGAGNSKTVSPVSGTIYRVTVTDVNGCTATGQTTVSVNGSPLANAGPDVTICRTFSTNLTASAVGGTAPYSYAWSDGLGSGATKIVSPLTTKTYTVTVTSANGCLSTDQVVVNVQTCAEICGNGIDDDGDGTTDCADSDCGPTATLSPGVTICTGQSTTLTLTASGGNGSLSYAWSHGLGTGLTKTVTPGSTTTYSVTVTASGSLCTAVATSTVTISTCPENCTNGIDDNGDGLADCADPTCAGVTAPILNDNVFTTCPGLPYSNRVTYNDENLLSPAFSISSPPANGTVTIDWTGKFYFTPFDLNCMTDEFYYQVCNTTTGCCETAKVTINFGDTTPPVLTNVPADIIISCDDAVPAAGTVTAYDQCPGVYVAFNETSEQYENGACETYNIIRTWTATDFCGNVATATQTISVVDLTPPELFRVYTLENGAHLIAGVAQRVTNQWKYVRFPVAYEQPPVVFAQLISDNDAAPAIVRLRNVSAQGFEVRLRSEEAAGDVHDYDNVAWMAVDPSSQTSPFTFEAGVLNNVTHVPQTLNFANLYPVEPLFISTVQTAKESDPFTVRHNSLTSSLTELFLQEETSADTETAHTPENAGYLVLQSGARLTDNLGQQFGESGKLNLTNAWTTITLSCDYTKPVILFGGLTKNDAAPVNIRVRNVTANSFEVHLEEWSYQDGNHPVETVSYLVVEGSIPTKNDFYCSMAADSLKPGENVFLMDNCDDHVNVTYQKSSKMTVTGLKNDHSWVATDDCGNKLSIHRSDTCSIAAVRLKALLSGALQAGTNGDTMRDDLRVKYYVPAVEPYSIVPGFTNMPMNYAVNEYENIATTTTSTGPSGGSGPSGGTGSSGGNGTGLYENIVFGYRTANNGTWSNPATWQGGVVPPFDCNSGQSVRIDHQVTVSSADIKLDNGAKLYVVNGKLTLTTGNFEVKNGTALFDKAEVNCMIGGMTAIGSTSQLTIKNCTVHINGDFLNDNGKRTLEGVCLTVGKTFENRKGWDVLTNVCATVQDRFLISTQGATLAKYSAFKVISGDYEIKDFSSILGVNLTIWVLSGQVKRSGFWLATVSNYCVAGNVAIPTLFLPYMEGCQSISGEFNACDCSFDAGNNGGGNTPPPAANFETIADGLWASAATWKNGLVPPTGDIAGKVVSIRHAVTVSNSNLKLKGNSTFTIDSGGLTMNNGDFLIQDAKVYFKNASFTSPNGALTMDHDSAYLEMVNCVVNLDEQFKNRKGKRKLENVCLTLNDDFVNDQGVDTLINVCAAIEKDFTNYGGGQMHIVNSKFKSNTGKFENGHNCKLTGSGLVIWVKEDELKNSGTWKALVDKYCIAGSISIPQTYRPLTEECSKIATFFNPCSCNGSSPTGGTTVTTTETQQNPYVAVGKMDVQLIEVGGPKAVVDWVVIELRDSSDDKKILKAITALVTRDGEVVSEEGDSVLYFPGIYEGNYYVTVRHRNHFGMMTDVPQYLSTSSPPELDFTSSTLPVRGGVAAGKMVNGKRTMWPGDFNGDGKIIYQGPNNDVFYLFSRVLSSTENTSNLANFIVNGYEQQDINLDGKVIYQGPNNDRAYLLFNSILSHPQNMSMLANFVILQNLP